MVRGAKIVRGEKNLTVYVNRWTILLLRLMCIGFIVVGATNRHGSVGPDGVVIILVGVVLLISALWMGLSTEPLLVVTSHGISSPYYKKGEPMRWEQIADIQRGFEHTYNTFSVRVWNGVDRSQSETYRWLSIPSPLLPMRTKKLIAEVLAYRPDDD